MSSLSNNKPNAKDASPTHLPGRERLSQSNETDRPRRAAVIGGGASGLEAAGELMKRNFQVTLFERHSQLGGMWCYERNDHLSQPGPIQGVKPFLPHEVSPIYKNLQTNVIIQSMGIDGFPVPRQRLCQTFETRIS